MFVKRHWNLVRKVVFGVVHWPRLRRKNKPKPFVLSKEEWYNWKAPPFSGLHITTNIRTYRITQGILYHSVKLQASVWISCTAVIMLWGTLDPKYRCWNVCRFMTGKDDYQRQEILRCQKTALFFIGLYQKRQNYNKLTRCSSVLMCQACFTFSDNLMVCKYTTI